MNLLKWVFIYCPSKVIKVVGLNHIEILKIILDMAGLLKPRATKMLIDAIRQKHPDLPIHLHTQ